MRRTLPWFVVAVALSGCPFTCNSIVDYCEETSNCICTASECCAPAGKPCSYESECCGNSRCAVPAQGGGKVCAGAQRADGGQCTTVSLVCGSSDACCSNSCVSGRCACGNAGDLCEFASDCCHSQCSFGRCGVLLPDGGYAEQ